MDLHPIYSVQGEQVQIGPNRSVLINNSSLNTKHPSCGTNTLPKLNPNCIYVLLFPAGFHLEKSPREHLVTLVSECTSSRV